MKISTILDHIDSGHMALPEFQRGYVWNRDQVRGLLQSLYRRHPVGSLLVWATQSEGAHKRGSGDLAPGVVKLLLDGQQRITSLYGVIRGEAPKFFDGNADAFRNLYFHVGREEFAFYQPIRVKGDPLWVDVTNLMQKGINEYVSPLAQNPETASDVGMYIQRLSNIQSIKDIDLHIEEVTGADKTIDVVVDIFNRVNSGGTKLSKGDLALAKICADAPDARQRMKAALERWRGAGYHFNLDWLLRNVNTVLKGQAKFNWLHNVSADEFNDGLKRAEKAVDELLNLIGGRLGLDHDRVLFGRYAIPTMAHYLDRRGGKLTEAKERDRLLFWYLHSAMWGRYSGSTESTIDKDLTALQDVSQGLDRLIHELRLWRGSLRIAPEHFGGWSLGARFYPLLYLLTRVSEAKDLGTGIPLKNQLLGHMSRLEVHHVFPKALLYEHGYARSQVNAIANFCFLTKDSNLKIGARDPAEYLAEVETSHPGVLESQWVPMDRSLWKLDRYPEFLEARKELLAAAANRFLEELLHGDTELMEPPGVPSDTASVAPPPTSEVEAPGGIDSAEEEATLDALQAWCTERGLPEGELLYELSDPDTGRPIAILDLAWPDGLQEGLSRPAAVLLAEAPAVYAAANQAGFQFFTTIESFKRYVDRLLGAEEQAAE
ncbi:MAG: GmrSD restriction endonuclease domain-containing protein [Myxococcota bacterium]